MAAKRNANGTFKSGSSGNPGGKRKGYLAMLQAACTEEKWRAICDRAIDQAAKGNTAARKWVSAYLLGKPVQRVKADVQTRSVIDARYVSDFDRVWGDAANGAKPELPSDPD